MTNKLVKVARPRASLSEFELCRWIGRARLGEILEYHRGLLALDRAKAERRDLDRLADRALWAADRNLVFLVQRRNGPNDYSYLAIARSREKSPARSRRADRDVGATTRWPALAGEAAEPEVAA
jgi:hypothetical protein